MARVIETTLYKITEDAPLTVRTCPVDAAWLSGRSALLERLHIGQIVADRRIDQGGCVIQSDGREWDATLTRQLDTLSEIVAEMIATQEVAVDTLLVAPDHQENPPADEPEVDDVPGLE